MIAIALACNPRLLIADEPTTALDVTVQAQVIALVKELRQQFRMSIVWITHDLGVMAGLADRIMVMYAGRIVERASADSLYRNPRHPYTRALLGTLPRLDGDRAKRLPGIEGQPPSLLGRTRGCAFAPRCTHAFARCREAAPALEPVGDGHEVACWWDGRPAGIARPGSSRMNRSETPLVEVRSLKRHFPIAKGVLRRQAGLLKAVDGLDFTIQRCETLGSWARAAAASPPRAA